MQKYVSPQIGQVKYFTCPIHKYPCLYGLALWVAQRLLLADFILDEITFNYNITHECTITFSWKHTQIVLQKIFQHIVVHNFIE